MGLLVGLPVGLVEGIPVGLPVGRVGFTINGCEINKSLHSRRKQHCTDEGT